MERCIARYGVEGATLERIADEAGMKRPALRHFVGNREALLDAVSDRFFARAADDNAALETAVDEGLNADRLLDLLFDATPSDTQSMLVVEALIAASAADRQMARRMRRYVDEFTEVVAKTLRNEFPNATRDDCLDVAAGIVGICFNVESLSPLGKIDDIRRSSHNAARRLVSTLKRA